MANSFLKVLAITWFVLYGVFLSAYGPGGPTTTYIVVFFLMGIFATVLVPFIDHCKRNIKAVIDEAISREL